MLLFYLFKYSSKILNLQYWENSTMNKEILDTKFTFVCYSHTSFNPPGILTILQWFSSLRENTTFIYILIQSAIKERILTVLFIKTFINLVFVL